MTSPSSVEDKTDRYLRFWRRTPVDRPLIGFSVGGWFPLQSYRVMQTRRGKPALVPDDLHAEEFLDDYEGVVALWDGVEDDMIRGVAPIPPLPWLEAMRGCRPPPQPRQDPARPPQASPRSADIPRKDE